MSYNILVILEDYVKDQFIVQPLLEKVIVEVDKPRAKVVVCKEPRFTGISECMKFENLKDKVIDMYEQVNLFLLIVDRDANVNRHIAIEDLENRVSEILRPHQKFIAIQTYQELEVLCLAGHDLPSDWKWTEIRQERDPKERYFIPFSKLKGYLDYPAQGRKKIMVESLRSWSRVKGFCQEDIGLLIEKMKQL